MSLICRIMISTYVGLSNLMHIMTNICVVISILNNVQNIVNNVIWNGKPITVKQKTLKADYSNGGL